MKITIQRVEVKIFLSPKGKEIEGTVLWLYLVLQITP